MTAKESVTPAQLALAWLPAREPWIVPIQGATTLHRLEENAGAASALSSPDDLRKSRRRSTACRCRGARYSAERQKLVGK